MTSRTENTKISEPSEPHVASTLIIKNNALRCHHLLMQHIPQIQFTTIKITVEYVLNRSHIPEENKSAHNYRMCSYLPLPFILRTSREISHIEVSL